MDSAWRCCSVVDDHTSVAGYRFFSFLPDGKGGALHDPFGQTRTQSDLAAITAQEQHFVFYAVPVDAEKGSHVYAIDESRHVYVHDLDERLKVFDPPAWNALYNGGAFGDKPAWDMYKR